MAPADHPLDHPVLVDRGGVLGGDAAAVPEHRHPVGDLEHVFQEVGDEDEAGARALETVQHGEQLLDLGRGQRGSRLVQDDDPSPAEEDAAKLDQLLQAERQPAAFGGRVDVDPEPPQVRLGLARHRPPAHYAGTGGRLVAEEHVLGHAQGRDDRQLLVDHADPGGQRIASGAEMDRPPVDTHLAVIAGVDPGDDLHQRRLARAVLAHEAMHLAGQQRKVDARQRGHAAERLADPGQLQDRLASARWRALAHVPVRSGSASASTACLPRWAW